MDGQGLLAMCFIVIFGTVCGFYFYLSGVKLVGAGNASMLSCIEPVAAAIMSVAWLKVVFQPADLLGFFLVVSAVLIISVNQAREERQQGMQMERRKIHGRTDPVSDRAH